jgi:hypothetical protein
MPRHILDDGNMIVVIEVAHESKDENADHNACREDPEKRSFWIAARFVLQSRDRSGAPRLFPVDSVPSTALSIHVPVRLKQNFRT